MFHTPDTYELTWDEFMIEVDDAMLIETGDGLSDEMMPDVLAAFEKGMSPWGCVIALTEAHDHLRFGDRIAA